MPDSRFRGGVPMSPLLLSHQLLALAEEADRAGLRRSASDLVELALRVCTDKPRETVIRAATVAAMPSSGVPAASSLPSNVTRLATAAA